LKRLKNQLQSENAGAVGASRV